MKPIVEECLRADRETRRKLLEFLETMITAERRKRFAEILAFRTRHITIVLEDIFQPHNASAVLRTCDCFGIQDVHIIENNNKYEINPDVALGSSKWLSLFKYNRMGNNTAECLKRMKEQGYRIIATTPHKDDYTPQTLPLDPKFALVFGTELEGLTDTAISLADGFVKIPMVGFTESLNISVSAAIFLHSLTGRLRERDNYWHLSPEEEEDILLEWTLNTVRKPDAIVSGFLAKQQGE
jgi:tRNA (guanosine-2'-O-)-methyltransferase